MCKVQGTRVKGKVQSTIYRQESNNGESIEINRYTTGVACKSWHGSLNPSDSYVPMIVAYPGGTKTPLDTLLRKDTTCGDYDNAESNKCIGNWKLTDIVNEIISQQYK